MELKDIMDCHSFVVVGNTINEEKYAYKIKHNLINAGYEVFSVGHELRSINDIDDDIDIIDLCINPKLGINYLKECNKSFKCVLIQPGAESDEIIGYLESNNIEYLMGCALVGLRVYKGKSIN